MIILLEIGSAKYVAMDSISGYRSSKDRATKFVSFDDFLRQTKTDERYNYLSGEHFKEETPELVV